MEKLLEAFGYRLLDPNEPSEPNEWIASDPNDPCWQKGSMDGPLVQVEHNRIEGILPVDHVGISYFRKGSDKESAMYLSIEYGDQEMLLKAVLLMEQFFQG